jgi:hypothetical protein
MAKPHSSNPRAQAQARQRQAALARAERQQERRARKHAEQEFERPAPLNVHDHRVNPERMLGCVACEVYGPLLAVGGIYDRLEEHGWREVE